MRALAAGLRARWRALRGRSEFDAAMAEEFRFHLERRTEDLTASGLSPADAARQARLEFGSIERYKEEGRESRGLRLLGEMAGELRYAARSLRRSPAFTLAAVLMLGLGIGANAAAFSLLSGTLLQQLPFEEPDRLVVLHQTQSAPGTEARPQRWSYPEFAAVRSVLTTVTQLTAYFADDVNLSGAAVDPVRVRAEMVSASYFAALGVRPVYGRDFVPQEDREPGVHPVVVLSHHLWSGAFGRDPAIVGGRIVLNNVPLIVVGVGPPDFRGLTGEADLWFPQAMAPAVSYEAQLTSPQRFHSVIGRLRPGVPIEEARAEVAAAGAGAADAARAASGAGREDTWGAALLPLAEARRHADTVRAQLVLGGAAFVVLLIAVVNLSGLLLARGAARAREVAVRAALGAGRLRLVRQGMIEGGLLGLLGGALGLLLAAWSGPSLAALAPERMGSDGARVANLAAFAEPTVDWRVMLFAACLALAAGLLAGVIPAVRSARGDLTRALESGSRGSSVDMGSLRRPTVLSAAAVAQVAFALVLLVGAGLLLEAFQRLRSVDAGFDPSGVITFSLSPPVRTYGGEAAAPLLERVLERVTAVPGVLSATVSLCTPFRACSSTPLYIEGRQTPEPPPEVGRHYVAADHFRTLRIPLLRGRALTSDDRAGRPQVAVINETAARRFWPGEDPIGKRVWFGGGGSFASSDSRTEIVGIVADVLYAAPGEQIGPDFYTSYLQFTWPYTTVMVRASGDPLALVPALRRAVADVDPHLPIHDVRTMAEWGAETLTGERFATLALVVFAGLGLLLACVGIYGIMAYSVAQRRREIGIRLALGATPRQMVGYVMRQGAALAAAGLVIGSAASLVLARALSSLIAAVGTPEPLVFAAVVPLLLLASLLACYLPASSATRINPVETITSG